MSTLLDTLAWNSDRSCQPRILAAELPGNPRFSGVIRVEFAGRLLLVGFGQGVGDLLGAGVGIPLHLLQAGKVSVAQGGKLEHGISLEQIISGLGGSTTMIEEDPPDHTRLRKLVSRMFTQRVTIASTASDHTATETTTRRLAGKLPGIRGTQRYAAHTQWWKFGAGPSGSHHQTSENASRGGV